MNVSAETDEPGTMKAVTEGLVPYVARFILNDWDWRRWMTVPPTIRPGVDEPKALPPGYVSKSAWSIAFEGAYPWAITFAPMAFEDGPIKDYLDSRGVFLECETGYAISVHPDGWE